MIGRKPKDPDRLTSELREHLIMADFLGELTRNERRVAQKHGLLQFDLWVKTQRFDRQSGRALSKQCDFIGGDRLAPSFEPDGRIRYPDHRYLVKNYADLQKFKDKFNL